VGTIDAMKSFILSCAMVLTLSLGAQRAAYADSATWSMNPTSGDWNTATNWTPNTVPNGPSDMATFGVSNTADVFLSASTEVYGITFDPGASGFRIVVGNNLTLTLSGVEIVNSSAIPQDFVAGGDAFSTSIQFLNSADVGNSARFTINGPRSMSFYNSSTAGNGNFTFKGTDRCCPGLFFYDSSNAGNGTFTFNPGPHSIDCQFHGDSSAGSGRFSSDGGVIFSSFVGFFDTSTADRAVLVATAGINGGNGGYIFFGDDSTGGTARVILFGSGTTSQSEGRLDVSSHNPPGVSIGSLEGSGLVEPT
jgi:hypothetical protein